MADDLIARLNSLIQLDYDAKLAYEQAIAEVREADIRETLQAYRRDHVRHTETLGALVLGLGETPRELRRDLKGFLLESFTAIRSRAGTVQALKAMEMNENLTNRRYREEFEGGGWPDAIGEIVRAHYEDERRHLAYIQETMHAIV